MYRFMPVQNGMGAPGLDYHCCIQGLAIYIETKAPGKDLTDRQKTTRDAIEAAGGLVFVIHNKEEIDTMLASIALHLRFAPRVDLINPNKGELTVKKKLTAIFDGNHAGPDGAAPGGARVPIDTLDEPSAAPARTMHRPGGGRTSSDAIMDHFTPSGTFYRSHAIGWLTSAKYNKNTISTALIPLIQGGYVRELGDQRYQFVKPYPKTGDASE
jgi:hypothetical protein